MVQDCKYCKNVDIVEVVPNLGVDVHQCIESGIIEDKSAAVFHNMMTDFAEIGHVAREPFDIIEFEHSYVKFRKKVNDEEAKKKKE